MDAVVATIVTIGMDLPSGLLTLESALLMLMFLT